MASWASRKISRSRLDFLVLRWRGYSAGRVVHADEAEDKVAGRERCSVVLN